MQRILCNMFFEWLSDLPLIKNIEWDIDGKKHAWKGNEFAKKNEVFGAFGVVSSPPDLPMMETQHKNIETFVHR